MPRRNCAAGTAGRPSRLKTRRAFFSAPQRGVFAPLGRGGERLRPTFLFLSREKKKRAAPGTKKKSAGSGFRGESCSFFVCALCPDGSILVLCGLVSPFVPLPLTGADGLTYALEPVAFAANAASFSFVSMS